MEFNTPFGSFQVDDESDDMPFQTLSFDGEINHYLIRYHELHRLMEFLKTKPFPDAGFQDAVVRNVDEEMKYLAQEIKRIYDELPAPEEEEKK